VAIISNATTIADAGAFSVGLGAQVLIKTLTASNSGTLSFVHGASGVVLDSTYPIYKFEFTNIHPSGSGSEFMVGFRDGGTDYDANNTTSMWYVYHMENDSSTTLDYNSSEDNANVNGFQKLTGAAQIGTDNDESASGSMFLFNPSSTVFVKHFISRVNYVSDDGTTHFVSNHVAGYVNVTAAIDAVQFKLDTNNISTGIIKLYGIKDS
jgi:hypothetical protein